MEINIKKVLFSIVFLAVASTSLCKKNTLRDAIKEGNLEVVKLFVEKDKEIVNKPISPRKMPLYLASKKGHLDIVKYLVQKGAQVNVADGNYSPLLIAIQERYMGIAKYLIEKGANVNEKGLYGGETPIYIAVFFSINPDTNLDFVQYLVKKGAKVNAKTKQFILGGHTVLYQAAKTRQSRIVKYLVLNLAIIHREDFDGIWPKTTRKYLDKMFTLQSRDDNQLKSEISKAIKSKDKDLLPYLFIVALNKIVDKINESRTAISSFSGTLIRDFYRKMENAKNKKKIAEIIAKELEVNSKNIDFSIKFENFLKKALKAIIDSGHSIAPKAKKALKKLGEKYRSKDFEKRMEFVIKDTF